jgi:glycosyltransferase involved in cell wall biosynthesis
VLNDQDLVRLYHDHDVLVYPSASEGFGLIPFQAAATGMPSLATKWWCDYLDYVYPIDYKLIDSPWPDEHHGQLAQPEFDHLVHLYRDINDHFEDYAFSSYFNSKQLHEEYSWDRVTKLALDHVQKKFELPAS